MLDVPMCGERVIMRLESIGIERLSDLHGRDAHDVMHEVNIEARREIWRPPLAITALENLIEAAYRERESPA